jgi:hypothetical protein
VLLVSQAYFAEKEAAAAAKQKAIEEYENSLHPWEAQMTACDLLSKYLAPFAPKEEVEAEAAPEAPKHKKDAQLDLLFAGAASKSKGPKSAGKVPAIVAKLTPVCVGDGIDDIGNARRPRRARA